MVTNHRLQVGEQKDTKALTPANLQLGRITAWKLLHGGARAICITVYDGPHGMPLLGQFSPLLTPYGMSIEHSLDQLYEGQG